MSIYFDPSDVIELGLLCSLNLTFSDPFLSVK